MQTLTLTQKVDAEKRAIKLVMLGDVIMAVLGFSFYSMTHSQAILMDAVYPLIDLIAALLTLRVVALLTKQATQSQPFGYAIFEPLLNFIKGILILMVILVAFYAAVHALLTGGRHIEAEIAVFYSIVASIVGFAFSYGLSRLNRQAQSSLIEVDVQGWMIGSVLSVAVGLSFGLAIWLKGHGYEAWLPYTDPLVVLVLILVMLPMPLKVLKDSGLQIIGRGAKAGQVSQLQADLASLMDAIPYLDIKTRTLQIGRMVYIQVYIQLEPQTGFSLLDQDAFRDRLYRHLKQQYDYLSLDIIYTANPIWVARSVGD